MSNNVTKKSFICLNFNDSFSLSFICVKKHNNNGTCNQVLTANRGQHRELIEGGGHDLRVLRARKVIFSYTLKKESYYSKGGGGEDEGPSPSMRAALSHSSAAAESPGCKSGFLRDRLLKTTPFFARARPDLSLFIHLNHQTHHAD